MEGDLISGLPESLWRGATLDSRRITGGELFFALAGERTDGHRFVRQALENGAGAAVVQSSVAVPEGGGLIQVEDTYDALHDLTRWARKRTPEKLVAVTGTVGKTTTKEMLAAMLARNLRARVSKSPGNLNNLFGFPVALLGIPEDAEYMVAEMGMSTPGELSKISRLGLPDVAIFTNVGPGHLEALGSLQEVAEAKAELLHGLNPDGLVVANRDDPNVVRIARRFGGRVVWFSFSTKARSAAGSCSSRLKAACRSTCRWLAGTTWRTAWRQPPVLMRWACRLPRSGRRRFDSSRRRCAAWCTGFPARRS